MTREESIAVAVLKQVAGYRRQLAPVNVDLIRFIDNVRIDDYRSGNAALDRRRFWLIVSLLPWVDASVTRQRITLDLTREHYVPLKVAAAVTGKSADYLRVACQRGTYGAVRENEQWLIDLWDVFKP